MRSMVIGSLLLAAGCSDAQWNGFATEQVDGAPVRIDPPSSDTTKPSVTIGTARQRSQFADGTVINLVGMASVSPLQLLLTADADPVTVQIFYVGDKTTDSGHIAGTATLISTISLAANQTKSHTINWSHAAFTGNYGCILADAIGSSPTIVFQTYVQAGLDIWSAGGNVFQGGSYRIPYWTGTTNAFLAVTNQSDFAFDVQFFNLANTNSKTVPQLAPLSTYLFNATGEGWTFPGTSAIQVFTQQGGTVALSGYELRGSTVKTRVVPVKAAVYP